MPLSIRTLLAKVLTKGKAVDEFEHMRQSLHDVDIEISSSYSQPSYYGEFYGQQQYGDS